MLSLETLIDDARRKGASDLHLEPGMPATLRVRGGLISMGEPLPAAVLRDYAETLLGPEGMVACMSRGSADLSKTFQGVRCRLNVLRSLRGLGLAIRLLPGTRPTLERLNLNPDIRRLISTPHGLVILCGPTGCGKSSTMAALLEELNQGEALHIITLEEPIEYVFRPGRALIRQREVGRDTPSFEQGLRDALREDPDVLMVGELRESETMRLALNAAETGHLVLTTVHAGTTGEALQRLVMAFAPEIQASVANQLADCLVGAVCQRLRYRRELELRIPECEILIATSNVRGLLRQSAFSRLPSALEAGGGDGMYTFARYATWVERQRTWNRSTAVPEQEDEAPDRQSLEPAARPLPPLPRVGTPPPPLRLPATQPTPRALVQTGPLSPAVSPSKSPGGKARAAASGDSAESSEGILEIPASEESLADILRELEKR